MTMLPFSCYLEEGRLAGLEVVKIMDLMSDLSPPFTRCRNETYYETNFTITTNSYV